MKTILKNEIRQELTKIGLWDRDVEELLRDPASGRFVTTDRRSRSSDIFENLNVEAIRFLTNWQVTGTIRITSNPRIPPLSFSLSLDEDWLKINIVTEWKISVKDPAVRIINSASTAELAVVFVNTFSSSQGTIGQGSFIQVKDVS